MDGGRRKKTMRKDPEWFKQIRSFAALFFSPVDYPSHLILFPSVTHLYPVICMYKYIYIHYFVFVCMAAVLISFYIWLFLLTVRESEGHGELIRPSGPVDVFCLHLIIYICFCCHI